MSTTQAVVVTGGKPDAMAIQTVPYPALRDEYLLVQTAAVALNPTDWKTVAGNSDGKLNGARIGCDYAGTVLEVGSKVTNGLKKGDKVAGVVFGSWLEHPDSGAFGNVITTKGDLQIKVPDSISLEQAATLGIGITTVGQSLYQFLKLPLPTSPSPKPFPILIYGGSTATGVLAIQFAKLSGFTVITTASPRNHDYLKSLGADAQFDYKDPGVAAKIRTWIQENAGGQTLEHVMDCIAEGGSQEICADALKDSTDNAVYGSLLPPNKETFEKVNPKIKAGNTLAYSVFGEPFTKFGMTFPANKEDYEFGKKFWALSQKLLAEGKLKTAREAVNEQGKGLEGVLKGLKYLADGHVSAAKLVFTL